jgi:hypothetical protein
LSACSGGALVRVEVDVLEFEAIDVRRAEVAFLSLAGHEPGAGDNGDVYATISLKILKTSYAKAAVASA